MSNKLSIDTIMGAVSSYEKTGFALVPNISDRSDFKKLLEPFGRVFKHPDAAHDGITVLTDQTSRAEGAGSGGFSQASLELHTDRANLINPPQIIAMLYKENSGSGGDALYVEGSLLYETLRAEHPKTFSWAINSHAAHYNDGHSNYRGPIFQTSSDGVVNLRFRADDFGYYSIKHSLEVQNFLAVAHGVSKVYRPVDHDVVILDNTRYLHGRTRFNGSREVWRVLLEDVKLRCGFKPQACSALRAA